MSEDASLPVAESQILGTNVYDGVLFTSDAETRGSTEASVADAKAFADWSGRDKDKPYVAKPLRVEAQIETQSKPYSACVFHHFSIVGGMEMHEAYDAVWRSDAYDVDVDADYQTGTLTITVTAL